MSDFVKAFQTDFTAGELDPRIAGRVDAANYYKGARRLRNVWPKIQGGVDRKPGSRYIADAPHQNGGRVEGFAFNTEQTYLFAFGELEVEIYRNGAPVATVVTPWPKAIAMELGTAQSADTMIVCHEDHEPQKIQRGATDAIWTIGSLGLTNIPLGDFNDGTSPGAVTEVHDVTFSGVWAAGDFFWLGMQDWRSGRIYWSADADTLADRILDGVRNMVLNKDRLGVTGRRFLTTAITSKRLRRGVDEVPVEDRIQKSNSRIQGLTGRGITVTTGAGPPDYHINFANEDADSYEVIDVVYSDVDGTGTVAVVLSVSGTMRREPVWSVARGWPKYPLFYEGRLWFGGAKSKPTGVFGSVTNDFFNFHLGDAYADDGIFVVLDTDQVNAVTGLSAASKLIIHTTGGEFANLDSPITPENISFPIQSHYGSMPIKSVLVEGQPMFAQRLGKMILEIGYVWEKDAWKARPISLLSPHLISQPVQLAVLAGTRTDTSNYVFVVNSDGTMAVLLTQVDQEVAAWTLWTTDGNYKSVAVVDDEVYFLVERAGTWMIELMRVDYTLDSAVEGTISGLVVSGYDHLEGRKIKVLDKYPADMVQLADQTVVSGDITLEVTPKGTVIAGLDYSPLVEPMPPATGRGGGTSVMDEKRIIRVKAMVRDTRAMMIDGAVIPDRQTDVDPLDTPPPKREGVIDHKPKDQPSDYLPTVTISQGAPLPMSLLAVEVMYEARDN